MVLIVGLLLALHGRAEPDVDYITHLSEHSASALPTHNDSSPHEPLPSGNHTDQHGCYHSHAPFTVVRALFTFQVSASVLITNLFSPPLFISTAV
jgi:hypothetical protein